MGALLSSATLPFLRSVPESREHSSCGIARREMKFSDHSRTRESELQFDKVWCRLMNYESRRIDGRRMPRKVATVNDANREFGGVTSMTRRAPDPGNRESLGSGGSMVAKLKLKGIDGRAPPGVEPAA